MFIGHYAPALAVGAHGKIKLWQAFIAVQVLDYAWAGLNMAGIEKTRIVEGFAGNSPLDLYYMPYTHSLGMSLIWAVASAFVFGFVFRNQKCIGAILFGVLVFSHWLTDLLVHKPDLALWFGSSKVGLGLWEQPLLANIVELGLFLAGMIWYLSRTEAKGIAGRYYPIAFIGLFAAVHAIGQTMPVPDTINAFAVSALFSYTLMALLAAGLDKTRRLKTIS